MKFTTDWLSTYVDTDGLSTEELTERLTMQGLEVEAAMPLFEELAPLKTAKILSAAPHPDADKLQVCRVLVGDDELEIVCGAPNARDGLVTAVALPGTTLPGGMKIKKSKVRGVVSNGMLCSEKELGLSEESDGIIELSPEIPHGTPLRQGLGLDDTLIEVDLTPNRADCASVIGIAREVAGFCRTSLNVPVKGAVLSQESNEFSVTIEDPDLCPRYAGKLIEGIEVKPSPWWLRKRLLSVGLRPINNVVDITNFVMLEYGQPLHAFDFDNLGGGSIVVRRARPEESTFTTLDDKERTITSDMLLICDAERPVAMAGVMGGMNSEVSETTTTVLLEAACFNAVSIRQTARKLNLSTDASYRFERGVDPEGVVNAMNRAAALLCELAGGKCAPEEGIDRYPGRTERPPITLSVSRCNELNGITLTKSQIVEMLRSIEINCTEQDNDTIVVTPPPFRIDIEREADLVEEIARLYGYDNIPVSLPSVNLSNPEQDPVRRQRLHISDMLTRIGFTEAINYSFFSPYHLDMVGLPDHDKRRQQVQLLNPLSEDQAVMRTMLLPGLLENVRRNINFQKTSIKLFEVGKVFHPTGENQLPQENFRIAGVLSGDNHGQEHPLYYKPRNCDILDAKGVVEYLLEALRFNIEMEENRISLEVPQEKEPFFTDGQTLCLLREKKVIGHLGKVATDVLKSFGIKQDVYFFDIDLDALCTLSAVPKSFSSLPKYPSVKRDIALVVADKVSAGELLGCVRESREKLIEHSEIFDIFQGDKIPEGYKSVALSITYRSANKTLTEKNVEKAHAKIVKTLTDKFGGQFREA